MLSAKMRFLMRDTRVTETILEQQPSFADLGLDERLLRALAEMGLETATEVQAAAIPLAREGGDLQVSAETGSGKTAAFLLPMLQRLIEADHRPQGTQMLVLTPTRELARQINKECEKFARYTWVKVTALTGGQELKYQAALLRRDPEIVIATPGRIVEHIKANNIDLSKLACLVFDEADRMFDMGFTEDLNIVLEKLPEARQTMLFSATLNHMKVAGFARRALNAPQHLTITRSGLPDSIKQQIVLADDETHKDKLTAKLLNDESYEKAIVFTNTKAKASKLESYLRYTGLRCGVIHSDFSQDERMRVLNLLRDGRIDILVATDVAARGIDVDGVDLVINYDMTRKGDEHVHRTGRTGRAGKDGLAISLVTATEWNLMHGIERYLKLKFEQRKVPGLEGVFKGPKKVKASGKAAGSKKKKDKKSPDKKSATKKSTTKKSKPKKPAPKGVFQVSGDGLAPLKRR
jgi:superfamily II DNA/RNA helicase